MFGGLTVRESLVYSALLKLPESEELEQKLLRVEVCLVVWLPYSHLRATELFG